MVEQRLVAAGPGCWEPVPRNDRGYDCSRKENRAALSGKRDGRDSAGAQHRKRSTTIRRFTRLSGVTRPRESVNTANFARAWSHGVEGVYDRHRYDVEKAHALQVLADLIDRILNPPRGKRCALARGSHWRSASPRPLARTISWNASCSELLRRA